MHASLRVDINKTDNRFPTTNALQFDPDCFYIQNKLLPLDYCGTQCACSVSDDNCLFGFEIIVVIELKKQSRAAPLSHRRCIYDTTGARYMTRC